MQFYLHQSCDYCPYISVKHISGMILSFSSSEYLNSVTQTCAIDKIFFKGFTDKLCDKQRVNLFAPKKRQ